MAITKTVMRMESLAGVPQSRTKTLLDVKAALEAGGHRIRWDSQRPAWHPAKALNRAVGRSAP
jgi:hypothetical protein